MSIRILNLPFVLLALGGVANAADAVAGKAYFAQVCTQCHTAEPTDGGGEVGPTLFKLYGRAAAVGDEVFPYSKALRESQLVWNAQTLERFLADPVKTVPGTTMPMPVPAKSDRDNLVAYLQSLAGSTK
jgi:cytochrome c